MAIATLSTIKAAVGVGARPNLFKVSFAGGFAQSATSNFSILCKGAALPGSTVGLIEVPMGGGRRLKLAGDRTFAEWTTTVLNDRDFSARTAIENFQKQFVFTDYNAASIGNRATQTFATVTVEQLNEVNVTTRRYTLNNCFVTDISTIELSYDTTDAIEEFTVTWVYDFFTVA
jgi:hypothetical protein